MVDRVEVGGEGGGDGGEGAGEGEAGFVLLPGGEGVVFFLLLFCSFCARRQIVRGTECESKGSKSNKWIQRTIHPRDPRVLEVAFRNSVLFILSAP